MGPSEPDRMCGDTRIKDTDSRELRDRADGKGSETRPSWECWRQTSLQLPNGNIAWRFHRLATVADCSETNRPIWAARLATVGDSNNARSGTSTLNRSRRRPM